MSINLYFFHFCPFSTADGEIKIIINVTDALDVDLPGSVLPLQLISIDGIPSKAPDDSFVTQPKDGLICMQWYQPLLDKLTPTPDSTEHCIILMYALSCKAKKYFCGTRWIEWSELVQVVNA